MFMIARAGESVRRKGCVALKCLPRSCSVQCVITRDGLFIAGSFY